MFAENTIWILTNGHFGIAQIFAPPPLSPIWNSPDLPPRAAWGPAPLPQSPPGRLGVVEGPSLGEEVKDLLGRVEAKHGEAWRSGGGVTLPSPLRKSVLC